MKVMKVYYRVLLGAVIIAAAWILIKALIGNSIVALFMPAGPTALQERNLIITMTLIMLIVVVPMFIALFTIAWKYRAGNKNAKYDPDRAHSTSRELMLWAAPVAIIIVLGILNWNSAHALDPAVPIQSANPPITIEVVALPWKWLFIYPAQNIATVNFIQFPVNTPVHFELTADAPMSSFWIPQLGTQIYAMAAMETQMNTMANAIGEFTGKDTEINGAGYAGMTFVAKSSSQSDFDAWIQSIQQSSSTLDQAAYDALSAPSENNPPAYYSSVEAGLFNSIMMKFMMPSSTMTSTMDEASSAQAMPMMPADMPGMSM
jgi:cytochrome o ubiquinol oxidase subunit II